MKNRDTGTAPREDKPTTAPKTELLQIYGVEIPTMEKVIAFLRKQPHEQVDVLLAEILKNTQIVTVNPPKEN